MAASTALHKLRRFGRRPAGSSSPRRCSPRRSRRLPRLGAAERGPRGGDLPRRPVRRPRLRALEQRLVLGALPALLQRHSTRRSAPGSARGWSARSRSSPRRPCSRRSPSAGSATGRWSPSLWFAAAAGDLAADRPHAVPARGAVRARGAARRRSRPPGAGGARGRAGEPRQPGRGAVRRPRRRRDRARRTSARAGRRSRSPARCPDRGAQPRLPDRRRGAVRVLAPSSRSRWPRSLLWLVPARVPGAADRGRPLRARSRVALFWSTTRSAATSPGSAPCSRGRCSRSCSGRAVAGSSSRSRSRCSTGSWSRRSATSARRAGDPATERSFYEPLLRRARPAVGSRAVSDRDPADAQPLGGRLRRPRLPDRARLAAPARVRGLRPVHRRRA